MRILLSEKQPKRAYIIAECEVDQKCLRIMFNSGLVRNAFSFWNGEGKIPKEWEPLSKKFSITAMCAIGSDHPIEDMTKIEKKERFQKEMMDEAIEKLNKQQAKQFNFLKDDVPF